MKKILLLVILFVFALCFTLSGCKKAEEANNADPSDSAEDTVAEETDQESEDSQPENDTTNQQTLEYLSLLGLDETCSYALGGTFPSGIEDKETYLVSVYDITEENFAEIESALQKNNFVIVSDISTNEDAQTRSYPYSNNNTLYIEIVFSYGAQYFDVTFNPTS